VSSIVRRALTGISLIIFLAFGCLTWASWPGSGFLNANRFNLTIYPAGRDDGTEIAQVLKNLGYDSVIQDADRIRKVKSGYRVVFYYNDKEMLLNLQKRLSSKKVHSFIGKIQGQEHFFLQIGDIFQDKAKAERASVTAKDITVLTFEVEETFKDFPYKGKIVLVGNVHKKELDRIRTVVENMVDEPICAVPAGENQNDNVNNESNDK
jgi:hypothetical protein